MATDLTTLTSIVTDERDVLLRKWMEHQKAAMSMRRDLVSDDALRRQSERFLSAFASAVRTGELENVSGNQWQEVREVLDDLSKERAQQGFSPSETATFVFSLKQPLFSRIVAGDGSGDQKLDSLWRLTTLLDKLAVYTTEVYQRSREAVIARQQEELMELSTPVVQLWEGILALPVIGTLDSMRTQSVMENLLQRIVDDGASIAIIDITGVPTVDTVVAQHLLKTVAAARLMGADCIISGIRPQIAQTIVHLGVDLKVTTKASLADAFILALKRTGKGALLHGEPGHDSRDPSWTEFPS